MEHFWFPRSKQCANIEEIQNALTCFYILWLTVKKLQETHYRKETKKKKQKMMHLDQKYDDNLFSFSA